MRVERWDVDGMWYDVWVEMLLGGKGASRSEAH